MTETQATPTTSSEVEPDAAAEAPPTRSRRKGLLLGLGVLLALLAAAALVLGWQLRQADAEEQSRQDALRYAQQTALNLTSISVESLDEDIQQVLDSATGDFKDDFANRSGNLRDVLTTNEVTSEGQVLEAALVRHDDRFATAIVVLDATVRNAQNPEGGVNTYRMKLEMERQGDQWLTSMLEFVG